MRLPEGIRRLFRLGVVRSQVSQDLDDELGFHFEEAVRDLVDRGLTESDARAEARARFGDERAYRRTLERIDEGRVRMTERSALVDAIVRTLWLALRRARRAPGFTASVVMILALGIGANAVMFEVVDRLLLSPPRHIIDAEEVRLLHSLRPSSNSLGRLFQGQIAASQRISYPAYQDFLAVDAFSDIAAYTTISEPTVDRGEAAHRAQVVGATANLFPLLGVRPVLGRFFPVEEDALAASPTAVLAHEYWDRRYGLDPGVLGRTIEVGDVSYTVVGIAPAGFTGAELGPVDVWIPISESISARNRANRRFFVVQTVARLAPGVTVEAAESEATARHRGGHTESIAAGRYDAQAEVVAAPIIAARGPNPMIEVQVARWLAGVSLVVLLIACFNVANLLLARLIQTRREIAVHLALGASRGRLIAELMTESLVLATMGAGAALLVARVLGNTVHGILLPHVALTDTGLEGRLLVFTLVAALATGFLSGLIPALQTGNPHLAEALKSAGKGTAGRRSRTRNTLLVGQVALSVVLLVGAGLFVQSLRTAQELDLGFDSQHIVVASLVFNETLAPTARLAIYERALEGIRRLPGVRGAGLTITVPFQSALGIGVRVPGRDSIPQYSGFSNKVGSGFFEAMGLTILQGRGFESADDTEGAPLIAVVSEDMARAVWPAGDALGACMVVVGPSGDSPCTEVVEIVENHRLRNLVENEPRFLYFLNQAHPALPMPPSTLMTGTTRAAKGLVDLIRDEAGAASTQVRFVNAVSMSDYIEPEMRSWRLGASMFTAFGFLALIVAGWGLYSVLAFDVALRQRELGIRSALGANVARIVRLVLSQAVLLVAVGVGIGLLASWAASRFVEPLLFQVSATDPPIYALVGVTLLLVAALAGSLPAWRATRVDPREALQAD